MTNFDFLKSFNRELYELGVKLEDDVINSPRAVTVDATQFLETLVDDIYRLAKKKLKNRHAAFYKKIDNLYRSGIISYIYKNKLQEAYNLRNRIHEVYMNTEDEIRLAFDLHKRLYFISKKYFRDFCDDQKYFKIPDYKKPEKNSIQFDNCIICGCENRDSPSNMCVDCNVKVENADLLVSIKNEFNESPFTKRDLISYGLSESEAISVLNSFSKQHLFIRKANRYYINDDELVKYISQVNEYIDIGLLITRYYSDKITTSEIKSTLEYWKGSINQKPFVEFYRLVNLKMERNFEKNLLESENIKRSMKYSSMDDLNIKEWFDYRKDEFINGDLNDAFILFNELLIKDFFKLKRKNLKEKEIKRELDISDEIYEFWHECFMCEEFIKMTTDIKKDLIIREIKKNKSLKDVLSSLGISQREFDKIYVLSKNADDDFYKTFEREYTQKRQKAFIRHLKNNSLSKAVRKSKISRREFDRWYYSGEAEYSDFYIKTTRILMDQYLRYRIKGMSKSDILTRMGIPSEMVKSWIAHDDLEMVREFESKNAEITSSLLKRGKIINALKEDKSKSEAIRSAGLTQGEFSMIYNTSKKEKSDFYMRFDEEYVAGRKRVIPKLLKTNEFYNTLQKSEITQKEFNKWFLKEQDKYLSTNVHSEFYLKTARLLMDKYLEARRDGKNRPDAAKSAGLSNNIIDKWLRHTEFDLYYEFNKKNDQLQRDLIVKGLTEMKSKSEISKEYDVSIRTIDEFIDLGKSGFMNYSEVYHLYENRLIPNLLIEFLDNFKTKPYSKALKNSKITEEELIYFHDMGKSGNVKFKKFSEDFIDLKIVSYVSTILSRKSPRIAFKNSNLTKEEFEQNKSEIAGFILNGRVNIMAEEIEKHKTSGTKLAKLAGISLDELYDWYIRGKEGDEDYEEFSSFFEKGVVIPRVMIFNHAKSVGIPKNWLQKELKKDLGAKEYKIWIKHGFINRELNYYDIDGVDEEKIKNALQNSEFIKSCLKKDDDDVFEFMKQAVKGNSKFSRVPIHISKSKLEKADKKEIMGV